jgi:carbon storage regulator
MLVLSRRVGESLVIGDEITITVLEFRGDVIRIGVDAPRHIQVRRQELLVELAETNRAAASPAAGAVAGLSRLVSGADKGPHDVAVPAEQPAEQPTTRPGPRPGPRPVPHAESRPQDQPDA